MFCFDILDKLKIAYEYGLKEIRIQTIIQLIYRSIVILWMFTVYFEYFITRPEKIKTFLTFLTNQTFTLTSIYFILGILFF